MATIAFGPNGKATFPTKYHGEVALSESNWTTHICGQPGRGYYALNGEKVATTLVAPDLVTYLESVPHVFIYYKRFDRLRLSPEVEVPARFVHPKYMAVVIDTNTKRVCTVYPNATTKAGV